MNSLLRLTLGLCGLALLTGCGDSIDHKKIRQSGFVYCGQSNPTTFNPQLVDSGITSETLSPQLYDTLLTLNPDTHLPQPSLATQWAVKNQGLEYFFTLRKGVQFQSTAWFTPSRALNADDVVFSFRRIIDSSHPFHAINHANYPWFNSLDFAGLVKDVKAIDEHTVKFTLNQPDNTFLSNISTTYSIILSAEYAQQLAKINQHSMLDSHPVGTGPFYLDEFQPGDFIRLRRHPRYWNGPAHMSQVVFDISQRGTGALAKLLRNECDVLVSPIASQIPTIKAQSDLVLDTTSAMNVAFIAVNTQHPILQDARVRKAINFAINRNKILDSVYYDTGSIAYNILPPSSWAYHQDNIQVRYDRNYALALLREAGLNSGIELTMSVPIEPKVYNPSPRKTAELIQANLADIGIHLHLIWEDRSERSELSEQNRVDLSLTGWSGATSDPDNFLRSLLSCDANQAGVNVAQWCNSEFDFLLDLALETERPRYRLNLYTQAQNILNQEFPVIPLTHGKQFKAYHKSLTGFYLSPFSTQPFHTIERISE
ncbi:ABC transporter substrate-binding protein SapA [Vibrio cincinnatiensis]|uniref:ABC transporter substrate-binding protein SapA n=1 Tax=Vibrio cincinnatiensis TaxID=675 RepID=UPI001EDCCEC1|nr:ABC transporter substrate-binding protein SapA [Vibrio cincinnatiensis]MCG3728279.1 peptide ABC transporter substrate-binding protein SapA [Vibrio cincinnatiensis]